MLQTVKQTPWCRLTLHGQASATQLRTGLPTTQLAGPWQMLLLGDGAVTRHLQLLTGADITVEVLAMDVLEDLEDGAPTDVIAIPGPRLRRQVWLVSATGDRLAYATSWWTCTEVGRHLQDGRIGIWQNLALQRTEHFRDIRGVIWGEQPTLSQAFAESGPLWGRFYLLWKQGQPMTLIYEVFSPRLTQYLGPVAMAD